MKKVLHFFVLFLFSVTINAQIGGYALKFDGDDDYVVVPHSNTLNFTAFSIEMWIYVDDNHDNYKMLGKTPTNATEPGFTIGITNKKLFIEARGSTSNYIQATSTNDIPLTTWVHVAMTWSSGGYLKGYVNGVEIISSSSGSFTITNANSMYIGRAPWSHVIENHFRGKMDEIRIWNVVRTQEEIKTNMYKEIGTHSNLKAYYKMSDGTGTSLTDNSGNSNTGTLNSPSWVGSGCFAGSRNALDFDGSNDYIDFTTDPPYNNSAITLEAWIKLTSSGTELEIMSWDYPHATEFRVNEGKLQFGIDQDGWSNVLGTTNINTGNWTHVAMVKNNQSVKLYVNGILDASGTISDIPNAPQFQIAHLYEGGSKYYFPGQIDEVRIWHTVRTESEIRENMMKNLVGNESGLVAYYRFDNYDGTTLYDLTSNGLNGTLTNMDATTDWVSSSAFNTWIGSESTSWGTASNWSNGVPSTTDNVGLYKWDLGSDIAIDNQTVNSVLFSSTSTPTITNGFNVNGNLLLEKDITFNDGQQITFGAAGYLSEGTKLVKGDMGYLQFSLNRNYLTNYKNIAGIGLYLKNNGSNTENINVDITRVTGPDPYEGFTKPLARTYKLSECTTPLDARFYYDEREFSDGTSEGDLRLYYSSDNGSTWNKHLTATHNQTDNYFEVLNVTSNMSYTFADNTSPLPVELQSLAAKIKNNKVVITWQTATEINNYGFEIERAQVIEGKPEHYNKIGYVQGHGNSNTVIDYIFTDSEVKYGKYAYRLKQIDNDGKHNYSNSVETEINNITNYTLSQNYPNPFNPNTTISYALPKTSNVTLKVYNILGKEVATLVNEKQEIGIYNIEFNASNLSSGIYYYKLETEGFSQVKKMTLIK